MVVIFFLHRILRGFRHLRCCLRQLIRRLCCIHRRHRRYILTNVSGSKTSCCGCIPRFLCSGCLNRCFLL